MFFLNKHFDNYLQFLGDATAAIPVMPAIDLDASISAEITLEDIDIFRNMYREHCENFLDSVLNLEFHSIEYIWRDFWNDSNESIDECAGEDEKYLCKSKFYLLCQYSGVQKFVQEVDCCQFSKVKVNRIEA